MPADNVPEIDFERACATHLYTLPFRRALGFFPSFPMTTDHVVGFCRFLGAEATEAELLDRAAEMPDGPDTITIVRDGVETVRTYWRASNVLHALGLGAK